MNSLIWIVMDSCRYDSFVCASTPHIDCFLSTNAADVERRYSYASWTAPSHYAFLMGNTPHRNQPGQFASQVYTNEFQKWSERLGIPNIDFTQFLPHLSLPRFLSEFGYATIARVSLPVLNESTLLSTHFDDYRLMENPNDFAGMIDEMSFSLEQPRFYFFNLGETHYPYMLDDEELPHLPGVHGVLRNLTAPSDRFQPQFFDPQLMARLHDQQVRCVEHVDQLFAGLTKKCPPGSHIIVTSDHGELFGEDNYFGHGPVMHEKVFEVPFCEGKLAATESADALQTRVVPSDVPAADAELDELRDRIKQKMTGLGYLE